eukprot:jgi/Ulvmu1/1332/UM011_0060.1
MHRLRLTGRAGRRAIMRSPQTGIAAASSSHITVVGSINVDNVLQLDRLPAAGETVAANSLEQLPGGKGANQAAAAAMLGNPTTMVGQVGSDGGADFMFGHLQQRGVTLKDTVSRIEGTPTGTANVMLLPGGENSIIIVGGANTAPWPLSDEQRSAILNAGVVLLQREIPEEVNLQVARMCSEAGVKVVLDVGGAEAPLDSDALRCISVLSPNETELQRMTGLPTGTRDEVVAAARELQGQGARDVLVKLGSKGSLLIAADGGVLEQPCFAVSSVVDTTGAGDCFTAAFCVATLRGETPQQAMRYASAAAALCIQTVGAMSSMPADADVRAFMADT